MEAEPKNKRKILHLTSWYPNRVIINDGNFIQKQIRTIAEQEENTVLAVYEDPNLKTMRSEIVEELDEGIRSYIIYHRTIKTKWLKILNKLYYYYKGYLHIQKKHGTPDLLHAHIFLYAGIIAWLLHIRFKIPYVVSEHSSYLICGKIPFYLKHLLVKVAANARLVLPVSDIIKEKLVLRGIGTKFEITGNVVDCNIFKPIHRNRRTERVHFLHISGFTPEKNIDGILEATSRLCAVRKDFTLTIAGDGDLNTVEKLIKKWNIDEKIVQLSGKKTEWEVAQLMQSSDAFILFSRYETFSVVTAEALACGLPVIMSDIPIKDIYRESNGLLIVEHYNPESLANSMLKVFDESQKTDPKAMHDFICQQFSKTRIAEKILNAYEHVLDQKRSVKQ